MPSRPHQPTLSRFYPHLSERRGGIARVQSDLASAQASAGAEPVAMQMRVAIAEPSTEAGGRQNVITACVSNVGGHVFEQRHERERLMVEQQSRCGSG